MHEQSPSIRVLTDKIHFFDTDYSLVWYILKQLFTSVEVLLLLLLLLLLSLSLLLLF